MTNPPQWKPLPISREALRAELANCLAYFGRSSFPIEYARSYADLFRSGTLAPRAEEVFDGSCFGGDPEAMQARMLRFTAARAAVAPPWKGPQDFEAWVDEELHRPRSLFVTTGGYLLLNGGAGEAESFGFLDEDGMPPWDLWLGLHPEAEAPESTSLLSWTPAWLAPFVADAHQLSWSNPWIEIREGIPWVAD